MSRDFAHLYFTNELTVLMRLAPGYVQTLTQHNTMYQGSLASH